MTNNNNINKVTGKYDYSSYWKGGLDYNNKGKKNKTKFPEFVSICKMKQMDLKNMLFDELTNAGYTEVINGDGYLYAKGTIPVLLTAHMDTVHKTLINNFYEYYDENRKQHIISSPQGIGGDDRCGIYMILQIIKTHKCSVLFCEDEEVGGRGSGKFCKTEFIDELATLKYLIELDRANGTDAVFYDCENDEFTKFIEENTGYKKAYGSFSDISNLSPECKVASVNLSCGYYNAHTTSEYVIVEEMINTIEVVKKLLEVESEQFEYIEKPKRNYWGSWGYGGYKSGYSGRYSGIVYNDGFNISGDYYDDYDDYNIIHTNKSNDSYKNINKPSKDTTEKEETSLIINIYNDESDVMCSYVSNAKTLMEAFGKFFYDNPSLCFDDIYDYEQYDFRVCDDGWYDDLM